MKTWYYVDGGEQVGPVEAEALRELAAAGAVSPETLVWHEGSPDWVEARTVEGLFAAGTAVEDSPEAEASSEWPSTSSPHGEGGLSDSPNDARLIGGVSSIADRVLFSAFAIGRLVSVLLVAMSIMAIVVAAIGLLASMIPASEPDQPSPPTPTLEAFVLMCEPTESEGGQDSRQRIPEDRAPKSKALNDPCDPYRDQLESAHRSLGLSGTPDLFVRRMCRLLTELEPTDRAWFLDGMTEFIESWKASKADSPTCRGDLAIDWYVRTAGQAIQERDRSHEDELRSVAKSELERPLRTSMWLSVLAISVFATLLFLFLPLLLQIERNTRGQASRPSA